MEEKNFLSKILVCLYIVIGLLAINTVVLILANGSSAKINDTSITEEDNADYDVSSFEEFTLEKVKEVFESDQLQVIYIGRESCGYCVKFIPILKQAQDNFKYTTKYLDISKITDAQPEELLKYDNSDNFLEQNFGSTPMVLLVKNGKLIDTWVGYNEYNEFESFLKNNKVGE